MSRRFKMGARICLLYDGFFSFAVVRQVFYFLFFCITWTIMATKIIAATIPIKGSHVSVMLCNTAFQFTFSGNIV